ncbi:MutS protein 1 [Coemansia sp. RSA 2320]|nr:MutS protein 1 [Coemansia sp. RSA 2320]
MGPGISSSAVLKTAREYRQKYPGSVLLVRVGDFYELYFEQADSVGGELLGLQVVDKKFRSGTVRFTGFPARSLLRYVELLVGRHGLSVALCEQFQDDPLSRTFARRVTRVITPGTLIEDQCVGDTRVHNYVMAVARADGDALGLAWLDVATGDFMTGVSHAVSLSADVARIRPREILADAACAAVRRALDAAHVAGTRPRVTGVAAASFVGPEPALLACAELSGGEKAAACAVLNYVAATQLGLLPPLQPPTRYCAEGHMRISAATAAALELVQPASALAAPRGSSAPAPAPAPHTLLAEIDRTRTSAGARLLAKRLTAPSTERAIIERRLDLVAFFNQTTRVRDRIYDRLPNIGDVERAVNKLSLNCGGPLDLLEIARTLAEVARIKSILAEHFDSPAPVTREPAAGGGWLARRKAASRHCTLDPEALHLVRAKERALQPLEPLVRDIELKIRPDADRDLRVFGFLRADCCPEITLLHRQLRAKDLEREKLQLKWQIHYKCGTLRLDTTPALGHFIEVSKRDSEKLMEDADFRMIQSLKSKVRFVNARWTNLLSEIEILRSAIRAEEIRVFDDLKNSALEASAAIRTNSKVLADFDVAISMSLIACDRQYTRPRLAADPSTDSHLIVHGRHPVVESQLLAASRQYVSNDCEFASPDARVLLLTGPNMGGKSTFLRQTALISILAQMGSFVPATDAHLHIFDAIYSRIGAHDNVALDQSTFMVEMSETADILRHATDRSLVILDEIGRGTATAEGISIAYATLRYLHDRTRCMAIFATHYHELVPHVVPALTAVRPLQTKVFEDGLGGFAFLHKVGPGICQKSHALYVAQIAGIPKEVLAAARHFAATQLNTTRSLCPTE